ncbi:MAG TPA: hypothetical protein VGM88_03215 [Kofleriaceae bacterium]|jgi:hypothetical protein
MYRDETIELDESDPAVGQILIAESLLASCERAAATIRETPNARAPWLAARDAYEQVPELWQSLDRARDVLAKRGANTIEFDELRPSATITLARATDDGVAADERAIDDARRAIDALKLAVPGVDWSAIERRTKGLVAKRVPLARKHRAIAGGAAGLTFFAAMAWCAGMMPTQSKAEAAAARVEATKANARDLLEQRKLAILTLQSRLATSCEAGNARQLALLLHIDGRMAELNAFAAGYFERCGDDVNDGWARSSVGHPIKVATALPTSPQVARPHIAGTGFEP